MLVCRRALGLLWPLVGSLGSCWFSALGGNQAFAVFPWRISACQCYVGSARIRVAWVTGWFPLLVCCLWVCFFGSLGSLPGCGWGYVLSLLFARGVGLVFLRLVGL